MKQKIIRTQFIIFIFMMLGKVIGFLREVLLASKFGTSYEMDTYSFAISMLMFLSTLGYGITTTIIPVFAEIKEKDSINKQEKLANNLISITFILGIFISVTAGIFSGLLVRVFAPGFVGDAYNIAVKLITIMNFSIIFILMQSVMTGILQTNNKFYSSASMVLVGNIITVIYLLLFIDRFGIIGFSVITVVSYLLQLLINVPSYKKLGFKYKFLVDLKDEKIVNIFKICLPILATTCVIQFATFINNFFGSLIGEGTIAIYNYSNRIITLGVEIFPIVIAMVIYPMLAELGSNKENSKFNSTFQNGLILMIAILTPLSILLYVFRTDVVQILYERNNFSAESTMFTSQMLLLLIPTMLAAGIRDLVNKACYSLKEVKLPMKISFITIIINIIVNIILYKKIGMKSLGVSTTVSTIFGAFLTYMMLKRKVSFIKISIFNSLVKIFISSSIMGLLVNYFRYYFYQRNDELIIKIATTITLGIIGLAGYIIILLLLGFNELKIFDKKKRGVEK